MYEFYFKKANSNGKIGSRRLFTRKRSSLLIVCPLLNLWPFCCPLSTDLASYTRRNWMCGCSVASGRIFTFSLDGLCKTISHNYNSACVLCAYRVNGQIKRLRVASDCLKRKIDLDWHRLRWAFRWRTNVMLFWDELQIWWQMMDGGEMHLILTPRKQSLRRTVNCVMSSVAVHFRKVDSTVSRGKSIQSVGEH